MVFENDNILSSKSYTVTKSGISPQRKLGSLRNFRLFLIRYELISVLIFVKIRARTRAQKPLTRAVTAHVRVHRSLRKNISLLPLILGSREIYKTKVY